MQEQRIEARSAGFSHGQRGRIGQFIGLADNEVIEIVTRINRQRLAGRRWLHGPRSHGSSGSARTDTDAADGRVDGRKMPAQRIAKMAGDPIRIKRRRGRQPHQIAVAGLDADRGQPGVERVIARLLPDGAAHTLPQIHRRRIGTVHRRHKCRRSKRCRCNCARHKNSFRRPRPPAMAPKPGWSRSPRHTPSRRPQNSDHARHGAQHNQLHSTGNPGALVAPTGPNRGSDKRPFMTRASEQIRSSPKFFD